MTPDKARLGMATRKNSADIFSPKEKNGQEEVGSVGRRGTKASVVIFHFLFISWVALLHNRVSVADSSQG